jgi:hypothetical protein
MPRSIPLHLAQRNQGSRTVTWPKSVATTARSSFTRQMPPQPRQSDRQTAWRPTCAAMIYRRTFEELQVGVAGNREAFRRVNALEGETTGWSMVRCVIWLEGADRRRGDQSRWHRRRGTRRDRPSCVAEVVAAGLNIEARRTRATPKRALSGSGACDFKEIVRRSHSWLTARSTIFEVHCRYRDARLSESFTYHLLHCEALFLCRTRYCLGGAPTQTQRHGRGQISVKRRQGSRSWRRARAFQRKMLLFR